MIITHGIGEPSVDGKNLGIILDVDNSYVLSGAKSKFYIPKHFIQKYEDCTLWFRIDEDEAKSKFMLGTEPVRS